MTPVTTSAVYAVSRTCEPLREGEHSEDGQQQPDRDDGAADGQRDLVTTRHA
jgi:hypothetical protein